jgi:hypothetical protein
MKINNESFTGPLGRIIYRICKNLSIPPEKLKDLSESQIDWLIENIQQDDIEESDRINHIYELLKPWLNFSLWADEQKKKGDKNKMVSASFEEEVAKHLSNKEVINVESQVEKQING